MMTIVSSVRDSPRAVKESAFSARQRRTFRQTKSLTISKLKHVVFNPLWQDTCVLLTQKLIILFFDHSKKNNDLRLCHIIFTLYC